MFKYAINILASKVKNNIYLIIYNSQYSTKIVLHDFSAWNDVLHPYWNSKMGVNTGKIESFGAPSGGKIIFIWSNIIFNILLFINK